MRLDDERAKTAFQQHVYMAVQIYTSSKSGSTTSSPGRCEPVVHSNRRPGFLVRAKRRKRRATIGRTPSRRATASGPRVNCFCWDLPSCSDALCWNRATTLLISPKRHNGNTSFFEPEKEGLGKGKKRVRDNARKPTVCACHQEHRLWGENLEHHPKPHLQTNLRPQSTA